LFLLAKLSRLILILPLLVSPAAPQVPLPPGEQGAQISIDVNLVVLHATVRDRQGRLVSDLREQDFQVYEDGQPQRIKAFKREDIPITAGLVVDHSASMRPKLAEAIAGARAFVQSGNPDDQIFVVNFNDSIQLGLPPSIPVTSDVAELERAISGFNTKGRTALYDAIAAALEQLKAGAREKKVLVLISDGGDNNSDYTLPETLKLVEQSTALIYAVGVFGKSDRDRNPKVLRRLARATGGSAFFPTKINDVPAICASIARDIRSQYTISYVPANPAKPGDYRTIRVTASAPRGGKLFVQARTGYRVGGP
jgi:VWFA-related protein